MQLMPGHRPVARSRPPTIRHRNVDAGTRYLRTLLEKYNGGLWHALAAYNAGPGAVEKYNGVPPYRETINYINYIGTIRRKMQKGRRGAGAPAHTSRAATDAHRAPAHTSRATTNTHRAATVRKRSPRTAIEGHRLPTARLQSKPSWRRTSSIGMSPPGSFASHIEFGRHLGIDQFLVAL